MKRFYLQARLFPVFSLAVLQVWKIVMHALGMAVYIRVFRAWVRPPCQSLYKQAASVHNPPLCLLLSELEARHRTRRGPRGALVPGGAHEVRT